MPVGIIKAIGSIFKKKAKEEGVEESTADKIVGTVENIVMKDASVIKAAMDFATRFEGKYSELQSGFERIIRSMIRPFLTIGFSVIVVIMALKEIPIPQYIGWPFVVLVSSWCGTKAFRDWKKAKIK